MIFLVFPYLQPEYLFFSKALCECYLLPQDSSSLESVMDERRVSVLPPCFSSWEGKERGIKFNEHFYCVPGALHMLFILIPQTSLWHISSHFLAQISSESSEAQKG